MNKKGSFRDVVLIAIFVFGLGLAFFTTYNVLNISIDQMIATSQINESSATVESLQGVKNTTERFDYVIFGTFIALILGLIITGYFIGGNFIFMVIYFIITIIVVILSAIFANVWDTVSQLSVFGTAISSFPITSHILNRFPFYMTIVAFIGNIAMFVRPLFGGGGQQ